MGTRETMIALGQKAQLIAHFKWLRPALVLCLRALACNRIEWYQKLNCIHLELGSLNVYQIKKKNVFFFSERNLPANNVLSSTNLHRHNTMFNTHLTFKNNINILFVDGVRCCLMNDDSHHNTILQKQPTFIIIQSDVSCIIQILVVFFFLLCLLLGDIVQ